MKVTNAVYANRKEGYLMREIYGYIKKINDGIRRSDKQIIIEGLESIRAAYHRARIPMTDISRFFHKSIYDVLCYFFNELFENHTELFLNDFELFSRYNDVMANMELEWPMEKTDAPGYYIGKLISLVLIGDKSALDLLKYIEKSISDYDIGGEYYFIIDAVSESGNTEILSYTADFFIQNKKNNSITYSHKLKGYVWALICALLDNGMYDELDGLYREAFDSDLKKMTGTYIESYFEARESVRYIKLLVLRYYKNAENVNQILCGIIDELCLTKTLFRKNIEPCTVMENAYALSEINYRTQDITFLYNFWWNLKFAYSHTIYKEIKSTLSEYEDLIYKLIVPTPFLRLSAMLYNGNYKAATHEFVEKYSVNFFPDITQKYPGKEYRVYSEYYICSYSDEFMLPLLEKSKVILNEPPDKSEYVKTLITEKSEIFPALLKNLDPDAEELANLIAVCVESRNYNAVNEIRKMLADKG